MTDITYTLTDVARMAGVKPRTIQFWTTNNVLVCDPETRHAGPGVRRQYELSECVVAAVLGVLSGLSVSVGRLGQAAATVRQCINLLPNEGPSYRGEVTRAVSGKADALQEALQKWKGAYHKKTGQNPSKDQIDTKSKEIGRELQYERGSYQQYERWNALWTALENREEAYILMHYDAAKGWALAEVGPADFILEVTPMGKMVPNSWGAFFIINTADLFRNFPPSNGK